MIGYAITKMIEDIKDNNPLINIDDKLVKDYIDNKSSNEYNLINLLLEKGEMVLMNNVDYKELKRIIIRSCKGNNDSKVSSKFQIDPVSLKAAAAELNLKFVAIGINSRRIMPYDIPLLSEYFEKNRLSWLSDNKYYTVLTFIDVDDVDETAEAIITTLETNSTDNPDQDKVTDFAKLVATKHCYFATVIGYRSNDPKWFNKVSYEIVCRANKVTIKDAEYQYNPKDF